MKILILNVGWSNKGNRALIISIMEIIKKFIPDAEFNLMGPAKLENNEIRIKEKIGFLSISNPKYTIISLFYLFKCICIGIFNRFNVHIPISKESRLFDYYDSDIVISSGGDHLSGEYGIGVLGGFISILYVILLGKPVVLFGESIGYYKNSIINFIAKFIFNRMRLIIVREKLSKKYLDDNKITKPKIYVTTDPAFILNPVSQSCVFQILSEEGVNEIQRPFIGINPSGLISRFKGKEYQEAEEQFTNTMVMVIDNLVESLDASIVLIPHVYTSDNDDRSTISKIFPKVRNKSKVMVINNEYSPQELKGIIGLCDLFISARMHATIASTSMLIPTVGIAYSHKMHGIIGETLGQERYILDIKDLNYENLLLKINDAWKNREEIKKELEIKIPTIQEKAMLNGKLFKELLDSLKIS